MGGCYSSDSEYAVTSPEHKLPADRPPRHGEKGLQYSLLTNGDSQHQEDEILKQSIIPVSAGIALPTVNSQLLSENVEKAKGVAPSDSGIESIGPPTEEANCGVVEKKEASLCRSCHIKLKRISLGSCEQCGHFRLDISELNSLVNGNMYCTCGHGRNQPDCQTHSTRINATSSSPKRYSDIPTRQLKSNLKKQGQERGDSKHVRMSWKSADSLDLGTSMNTCMDRAKSEASDVFGDDVSFCAPLAQFDSVDRRLDATELGPWLDPAENEDVEEGDSIFFTSRMSIYSEILELTDSICHCDFSETSVREDCHSPSISVSEGHNAPGSEARQPFLSSSAPPSFPLGSDSEQSKETLIGSGPEEDEDSGHSISKSDSHLGSSTECETEDGEEKVDSYGTMALPYSPLGFSAVHALQSLSNDCEEALCPVSLVVKGRQMVLMDAKAYSQVLSDLHMLKQQLCRLARVIQDGGQKNREKQAWSSSQSACHRNEAESPVTGKPLK